MLEADWLPHVPPDHSPTPSALRTSSWEPFLLHRMARFNGVSLLELLCSGFARCFNKIVTASASRSVTATCNGYIAWSLRLRFASTDSKPCCLRKASSRSFSYLSCSSRARCNSSALRSEANISSCKTASCFRRVSSSTCLCRSASRCSRALSCTCRTTSTRRHSKTSLSCLCSGDSLILGGGSASLDGGSSACGHCVDNACHPGHTGAFSDEASVPMPMRAGFTRTMSRTGSMSFERHGSQFSFSHEAVWPMWMLNYLPILQVPRHCPGTET
mmetsp:Transcript_6878/g.12139  ORF Transcript_6878/g.12139 Transcript_6878/m.12139 type:complete len:273 (-) Transcript_6878:10-828(-)